MADPVTATPRVEPLGAALDPLTAAARLTGEVVLLHIDGWWVLLADPVDAAEDVHALGDMTAGLRWRDRPPSTLPFHGAAAGYLTTETGYALLDLPETHRPSPWPGAPLRFGLFDTAACWDPDGKGWLVAADLPGRRARPGRARLDAWRRALTKPTSQPQQATPPPATAATTMTRAAHREAVAAIREWIAAGDLYQLNLTFHVQAPWPLGGEALARRLFAASPGAAHAAWLRSPSGDIVSISPETFLSGSGDEIAIRPIKGTRPRHPDPHADAAAAGELEASAKDRAEHMMIVDLERNDLGRVCVPGSVRTTALAATEAHPTVWHLVSTVTGRLRDDVGFDELLRATFPCGSVTGAPKHMATSRIPAVEPAERGPYCGGIGLVGPGRVHLSVAIRTAVLTGGIASYGTGGGIVADSVADEEWEEARSKAAAFLTATNARW